MKVIIKTTTDNTHVNDAIDILFPTIKNYSDLGKPLINYPYKTMWVREYEGELTDGTKIDVTLYIRKIRGGISISGESQAVMASGEIK